MAGAAAVTRFDYLREPQSVVRVGGRERAEERDAPHAFWVLNSTLSCVAVKLYGFSTG